MIVAHFIFLLFFASYLLQDANCNNGYAHNKIVGGTDIDIEERPEQAYLLTKKGDRYYECGGSILDEYTILTAAQCLIDVDEVYTKVGITDKNFNDAEFILAEYTKIHPEYDSNTNDYDVAIVRLNTQLTLDGVNARAVRLVDGDSDVPNGTEISVTGWGRLSEGGPTSATLASVNVFISSWSECKKVYPNLTNRMICAGVENGGKDACQGDFGGPAVLADSGRQVGIVSVGQGCARSDAPRVYTNIANEDIRSWIIKNSDYEN